ncbi:hypothetical protein B0H10DRAFT_2362356 [Mycena sp. CBHHK59/15]|nr:hypothetical protein B0H10DRAFT_2362356 [Mycena sp. CBHHK59/15]
MPAERSRGSRRTGADGTQLVWTQPVEPLPAGHFAFATALTPRTFAADAAAAAAPHAAPPPSRRCRRTSSSPPRTRPPPSASRTRKVRPHLSFLPRRRARRRARAAAAAHPAPAQRLHPLPLVLHPRAARPRARRDLHSTLSTIIGLTWQGLPEAERRVWHARARAAREEHRRRFPGYAFRPRHRAKSTTASTTKSNSKSNSPDADADTPPRPPDAKRRVREVGPTDHARCAHIAALLVAGHTGPALDAAIAAFDAGRVKEVVARFEEPMTPATREGAARKGARKVRVKEEHVEGGEGGGKTRRARRPLSPPPIVAHRARLPRPSFDAPSPSPFDFDFDFTSAFPDPSWPAAFGAGAPSPSALSYPPPRVFYADAPSPASFYDSCPASPALSFASSASSASCLVLRREQPHRDLARGPLAHRLVRRPVGLLLHPAPASACGFGGRSTTRRCLGWRTCRWGWGWGWGWGGDGDGGGDDGDVVPRLHGHGRGGGRVVIRARCRRGGGGHARAGEHLHINGRTPRRVRGGVPVVRAAPRAGAAVCYAFPPPPPQRANKLLPRMRCDAICGGGGLGPIWANHPGIASGISDKTRGAWAGMGWDGMGWVTDIQVGGAVDGVDSREFELSGGRNHSSEARGRRCIVHRSTFNRRRPQAGRRVPGAAGWDGYCQARRSWTCAVSDNASQLSGGAGRLFEQAVFGPLLAR